MRKVCSLAIIFTVVIDFLAAIRSNIFFVALLALVDMTISHFRVTIEFSKGLFSPALETGFSRCTHGAAY